VSGRPPVPDGFDVLEQSSGLLFVAGRLRDQVLAERLHDPERWKVLIGSGSDDAPGRGATARLTLAGELPVILKRMRRGGLAGRLWRDRYAGRRRLLDNLAIPIEAARRGIPTAAPVALLLAPGSGPLYEGWLAVEEIAEASDLAASYRRGVEPPQRVLRAVAAMVRGMHDAGLEHRDLNLGNLLAREHGKAEPEPFVIDLDRARLHRRALPFRLRQRALRRLERSQAKLFLESARPGPLPPAPWYELYAAGNRRLAARLARGRPVGRLLLALHRLGWPSPR
jgi:3-deoxy-D-manno-octulosonic acid kinase